MLLALMMIYYTTASSIFTLSNTLGSNMVLQRNRPIPLWGWATPGATIITSFREKKYTTSASADDGLWKQIIPKQTASLSPITILFSSSTGEKINLTNILIGDVFFCSGQSNMEFTLNTAYNRTKEIAAANNFPYIRVQSGPLQDSDYLKTLPDKPFNQLVYMRLNWSVANNNTIGCASGYTAQGHKCGHWEYYSAVCWFAIRDIFIHLGGKIPVGGIAQTYGGTSIQQWMSSTAMNISDAPPGSQCCGQPCATNPNGGSCLWNAQVYPYTIGPTQLSAVLWYQGEQNAGCGGKPQIADGVYTRMMTAMISDWRLNFKQPSLIWGSVLLAAWQSKKDNSSFPLLRLSVRNVTSIIPGTFTISAIDQGDPNSGAVHSPYKQAVGMRASLGVRALFYKESNIPYMGPVYQDASITSATPNVITISISFVQKSLYGNPLILNTSISCPPKIYKGSCESFAIQTADCTWHPVTDLKLQNKGISLLLTAACDNDSPCFKSDPVATRGYFANWPVVMLRNTAGFPAEPWMESIVTTNPCLS